MKVGVRVDLKLDQSTIVLSGPFGLAHAIEVARAIQNAETELNGCHAAEVDLAQCHLAVFPCLLIVTSDCGVRR